jgi:hypothetical protein
MALTAYSLAVPADALESVTNGLPPLSEISAPRGFLPPSLAYVAPAPARQSPAVPPPDLAAPRGFLPNFEARR